MPGCKTCMLYCHKVRGCRRDCCSRSERVPGEPRRMVEEAAKDLRLESRACRGAECEERARSSWSCHWIPGNACLHCRELRLRPFQCDRGAATGCRSLEDSAEDGGVLGWFQLHPDIFLAEAAPSTSQCEGASESLQRAVLLRVFEAAQAFLQGCYGRGPASSQ